MGLYIGEEVWPVVFHEAFSAEFDQFSDAVQDEILELLILLRMEGPRLGRPHVDTLKASKYKNMKELRAYADNGVWRIAFAFDPDRQAVLLVAADKAGKPEKRFYRRLIATADERFSEWLKEG